MTGTWAPWLVAAALAAAVLLWGRARAGMPSGSGPTFVPTDRSGERSRAQSASLVEEGPGDRDPRRWGRWRTAAVRERHRAARAAATCELLDLCVAGLRAGLEVEAVLRFARAEVAGAEGVDDPDIVRTIGQARELSESCGVPLADAWASAAQLLREREALRRKVATALAGPRATIRVLTLLPLAGPVVGLVFGVDPVRLYAGSSVALACAVGGLMLLAVGRWWCRMLVRRLGLGGLTG